jgi:hypothetical protein
VTYIENHDHSTVVQECGGRSAWWRTQPLAIALLTTSGAPLIHNGQEWGEEYWFPESGDGRVKPRPLRWHRRDDAIGRTLFALYRKLIAIRRDHPALRTQSSYPEPYDERMTRFDAQGYGVDEGRDLVIFHRWGHDDLGRIERFIVALNFSAFDQRTDIPFSTNGTWTDLLNGTSANVAGFVLRDELVNSHWGRVYFQRG